MLLIWFHSTLKASAVCSEVLRMAGCTVRWRAVPTDRSCECCTWAPRPLSLKADCSGLISFHLSMLAEHHHDAHEDDSRGLQTQWLMRTFDLETTVIVHAILLLLLHLCRWDTMVAWPVFLRESLQGSGGITNSYLPLMDPSSSSSKNLDTQAWIQTMVLLVLLQLLYKSIL